MNIKYEEIDDILGSTGVQRANKAIVTSRLSTALDKCKVSDRYAVHLLTACIESISLNLDKYIINQTLLEIAEKVFKNKLQNKFVQIFLA